MFPGKVRHTAGKMAFLAAFNPIHDKTREVTNGIREFFFQDSSTD